MTTPNHHNRPRLTLLAAGCLIAACLASGRLQADPPTYRLADLDILAVNGHQDIVQFEATPFGLLDFLYIQHVSLGDAILSTTGADYGVHVLFLR